MVTVYLALVEVSLLMVVMILFGTARVRLLENTFAELFPVPRGRWQCWHAERLVHDTSCFSCSQRSLILIGHSPFLCFVPLVPLRLS